MSAENVELSYRAAEAFNRRDLDAFLALQANDVEGVPLASDMEGGYHGHGGTRRAGGRPSSTPFPTSPSRSSG